MTGGKRTIFEGVTAMTTDVQDDEWGGFDDEAFTQSALEQILKGGERLRLPDEAVEPESNLPDRLEDFRTALGIEWAFALEHKITLEQLFVPPRLVDLRKRNRGATIVLTQRLSELLDLYQACVPGLVLSLNASEWFRFHLLEVMYHLVNPTSSEGKALIRLMEINARLTELGFSDSSNLLKALNVYMDLDDCQPVEGGVILATAIAGGSDKDRDGTIQKRYHALTQPMPLVPVALAAGEISEILNREFPWMGPVTLRLCAHIEEQQRYGVGGAVLHKPVLLVGAPGSGKTHYAQRFAELTRVPFRLLSIGGMNDNMLLKGSARSWSTSRPGVVPEFMVEHNCPNPVFILDEIDKAGGGKTNGNVYDTLIQLLEPRNAAKFFDECLLTPVDLSRASYLATANSTESLPEPLKDRMLIWRAPTPQPEHLVEVAHRLWWQHWQRLDIPTFAAPSPDSALLERAVGQAASIRQVKSIVDLLLRRAGDAAKRCRLH
jgi:hypothetical protein